MIVSLDILHMNNTPRDTFHIECFICNDICDVFHHITHHWQGLLCDIFYIENFIWDKGICCNKYRKSWLVIVFSDILIWKIFPCDILRIESFFCDDFHIEKLFVISRENYEYMWYFHTIGNSGIIFIAKTCCDLWYLSV